MQTIFDKIDSIAIAHPDWPAVNYLGTTNTYGELKQASDAVAANLASRSLTDQAPIMVFCDQSFTSIATFLGCVKAGHAYIPVDTHSPNDRLQMIEEIAKPALVIAVDTLPIEMKTPVLDPAELKTVMTKTAEAPKIDVKPDDNYYIIFTSGTTGQPKGVQISHKNLLSFTDWMNEFNLPKQVKMLAQAPFSFDLSVMSLYPTLTNGGCLQILPREATDNLKMLYTTMPKMSMDVWVSTPSFIEMCLLDPTFTEKGHPNLKQFFFCGEELTHSLAKTLLQRFPNAAIYNTYGPTETTVAVTAVQITNDLLSKYGRLPIGYAKSDTKMSLIPDTIRDEDDHKIGELLIAGPSVSKGYLNRPEKTAKVFATDNGVQSYRTGDLGFINDDGLIFYRGRTDFQIKLNGFRIELEEVNHYLDQAPMIHAGVAVPRYNKDHKVTQLIALVVPEKKEADFDENEMTKSIRTYLQGVMMSYMIPTRFIYRDSLPLTQNGKVAIKQLISEVNS